MSNAGGPDSSAIGVPQARGGILHGGENLLRLRRPDRQAIAATQRGNKVNSGVVPLIDVFGVNSTPRPWVNEPDAPG